MPSPHKDSHSCNVRVLKLIRSNYVPSLATSGLVLQFGHEATLRGFTEQSTRWSLHAATLPSSPWWSEPHISLSQGFSNILVSEPLE